MNKLLLDEHPLVIQPSLASSVGLNEAIFLQQLHYWLNPKHNRNKFDGSYWVRNTYSQWSVQFPFWGERTIRRIVGALENADIIQTRVQTYGYKKTKFYTIRYDTLNTLLNPIPPTGQDGQIGLTFWSEGVTENKGFEGQATAPSLSCMLKATGQVDQMDVAKMASSYKRNTETTLETSLLLDRASNNFTHEKEENCTDEKTLCLTKNKTAAEELVDIWNKTTQPKLSLQEVNLTPKRSTQLLRIFNSVFKQSTQDWTQYCEKISSTGFLTGKADSGFKAYFDWAIKPTNAAKVLEGAIYDKISINPNSQPESTEAKKEYTEKLKQNLEGYPTSWIHTQLDLLSQVGMKTYQSWFSGLQPSVVEESTAVLYAPTQFVRDKLHTDFFEIIRATYLRNHPDATDFCLKVLPSAFHTPGGEKMEFDHG